jgi:hypothetical protein
MDAEAADLLGRLRPVLARAGLAAGVVDYRALGVAGDGDACRATMTDRDGRTVAESWGPTPHAALCGAVAALQPTDD